MNKKQLAASGGLIAIILITIGMIMSVIQTGQSFATVTFTTNVPQAQASLIDSANTTHTINFNQPIRLKKDTYKLVQRGEHIQPRESALALQESRTVPLTFYYTAAYLTEQLAREKAAIHQAVNAAYPKLTTLYTIHHEALYSTGNYYGATLRFKDTTSPHRDTLHILLEKKEGSWRVRSTPPQPILSAPDYPDVDKAILRAINQGE